MWREHTREKTGRPGLAVGVIAFAFAGTLGLAQLLTQQRNVPLAVFADESLDDWPIQLRLPSGYVLHNVESILDDDEEPLGAVAVFRRTANAAPKTVRVSYAWFESGTTNEEALLAMSESRPDFAHQERLGSSTWLYAVIGDGPIHPKFVGATCWSNGLAVFIAYTPGTNPLREEATFKRICESISVKDGYDG